MALSHKDWELPNSRIWLAEMDIDRGLDSIPSPHWGLTWDSIAPARTQCIAAFQSEQT